MGVDWPSELSGGKTIRHSPLVNFDDPNAFHKTLHTGGAMTQFGPARHSPLTTMHFKPPATMH